MIRKVCYFGMFVGTVLMVINLMLSNSLASEGSHFSDLTLKRKEKEQLLGALKQEIMTAQSMASINERANALGLDERVKVSTIQTAESKLVYQQ